MNAARYGLPLFVAALGAPLTAAVPEAMPTSRAALDTMVAQRFGTADTNRDGGIDRAEAAAALGMAAAQVARRPSNQPLFNLETGDDGRPRISLNDDGAMGSSGMLDILFNQVDRSRDGKLSQPEVQAAFRQRFDAADRNRDGVLSPAEMQSARGEIEMMRRSLGI